MKFINQSSSHWSWLPSSVSELVKPGVKNWLQSILEAEYVLTDSFHGMAFSIIFEKQFWAIGNERRGLTRFSSLLDSLGIQNRLMNVDMKIDVNMLRVDYTVVRDLKNKLREKSLKFLNEALN